MFLVKQHLTKFQFLIKLFNTYYVTTLSMTTINAIYIICVCIYIFMCQ